MDAEALKKEIESGPLAAALAPFLPGGKLHATGAGGVSWASCIANRLNAPTQRGPVPIGELAAYCCRSGVTGGVMALLEIPIGAADDFPTTLGLSTKGMLHTVLTLLQLDYRLTTADVDDPAFGIAADGLVSLGVMTKEQRLDVLALAEGRRGRAESLFGVAVTEADVSSCFGGN